MKCLACKTVEVAPGLQRCFACAEDDRLLGIYITGKLGQWDTLTQMQRQRAKELHDRYMQSATELKLQLGRELWPS